MAEGLALAQAVCARLCHDLGGATGALAGALELLDGAGDDAAELARDAARVIDRRLRFWRAATGGAAGELDAASLGQLAEGLTLGRRLSADLEGLQAPVPSAMAQPLLLAMLVAAEAMPRGGTLHVAGHVAEDGAGGISVWPEGPGAAWPAGLPSVLAGQPAEIAPRGVAVPLLGATAAAAGVRLDLLLGPGPAPGPLMLTPA